MHNFLQVVFRQDRVYLYFKDKEFKDDTGFPTTMDELECIIKKVDSWIYCAGGPPAATNSNIRLDAAYQDGVVWRHNKCPLILQKGKSCMKCLSVYDLLRKIVDRSNKLNFRINMLAKIDKGRSIIRKQKELRQVGISRIKCTPRSKKKKALCKNEIKNLEAQLTRRDKKIKELENSLSELSKKDADSVQKHWKTKMKTELPEEQV